MAFDRQFDLGLLWRLALSCCSARLAFAGVRRRRRRGDADPRWSCVGGAVADLWHHLRRTNMAVARFIEAIRFDDF